MKWFARRQPADIWDEPIQGPIGDIDAAERIRNICEAARAGAEAVGGSAQAVSANVSALNVQPASRWKLR